MLIENIVYDIEEFGGYPLTYGDNEIPILIKNRLDAKNTDLASFFILKEFNEYNITKKSSILLTGRRGSSLTVGMTYILNAINRCNLFSDTVYPMYLNYNTTFANKDNVYVMRNMIDSLRALSEVLDLDDTIIGLDMLIDMRSNFKATNINNTEIFKRLIERNKCEVIANTQSVNILYENIRHLFRIYCTVQMNKSYNKLYLATHIGYDNFIAQKVSSIIVIPDINTIFNKLDTLFMPNPQNT